MPRAGGSPIPERRDRTGRRLGARAPLRPPARRAFRLGLAAAAALLLLLSPGCFGLYGAHVPESLLAGWTESESGGDSTFLGISAEWKYVVYEYSEDRLGGPYPASLSVLSLETFSSLSERELRERLEDQVQDDAEAQGIAFDASSREGGSRAIASGAQTQYFTYRGTSGESSDLFQPGRQVRVVGEVFTDEDSGIYVLSVGLAQVTGGGASGGIFTNAGSWERIVRDPDGTIDGARGDDGLLHNVVSHK